MSPTIYIGTTTVVDIRTLLSACRDSRTRLFNAFLYIALRAMNDLENFRYRARDGEVLLYDRVDPSFNVLDEDEELFYFAHTEYTPNFRVFDAGVEAAKKTALSERSLDNDCGDLGLVYVSCLPCFGFTDIIRPMGLSANDSIPRLVWGKYHEEGGRTVMPFSITGNHGLFDGIHIAMLLDAISSLAEDPAFLRSS